MVTKFVPPKLPAPILRRPRLLEALLSHLDRKLLLITADAGYGKTTLVAGLVAEAGIPCAWYRVERTDCDRVVFLEHFLESVRQQFPHFGSHLRTTLQTGAVNPEVAMTHLANDLCTLPDLLIVLDDYHQVDGSQEVNRFVDDLLDHLPATAHLLVATRTTPHLSLSRLRAQNQLFEVVTASLRFTLQEMEALFAVLGVALDPEVLQAVASRTEGWVGALVLAYHSIKEKNPDEIRRLLHALRGSARYIHGYLSAEVFRLQVPDVQSFLRATSVLPRLHADICDALLDRADARHLLQYLERNNLFTHALDEERSWYRYHPLFQEFLQARLITDEGATRASALSRKAGAILEQRQLPGEAFEQYARAGDWIEAARLLSELGSHLLDVGRLHTVQAFLGQIPAQVADEVPELHVQWGRLMELRGQWTQAREQFARALEISTARGEDRGKARALMGLALTYFRQGQYTRCMELCEQALLLVSSEDRLSRAEVLRLIAGCCLETDDLDRGEQHMKQALGAFRALGRRRPEAQALHNLAYSVHFVRGDFQTALRLEVEAVRIAEELNDPITLSLCLIGLGHLHLMMGRHQEALAVLEQLLRLCDEWQVEAGRGYALMIMADVRRELGQQTEARRLYDEALALGERLGEPTMRLHTLLGLAGLLSELDPEAAGLLADKALALAGQINYAWFRGRSLMVLGAINAAERKEEAVAHFREAVGIFETLRATYDLARAHLHLAALVDDPGRRHHLAEALTLGERGAYDALFVHTEREIARPLLVAAVADRIRPDYAGRLLVATGTGEDLLALLAHSDPAVRVEAARLLAGLDDRRALRSLRSLLRDRTPQVREAAEEAIEQLSRRPPAPLHVYLLGPLKLFRGNEPIPEVSWKRSSARTLFQYLAGQYPRMSPEEAILEALWPTASPHGAHAGFHTALHALRKVLEPDLASARDSAYIVSHADQYGLNPRAECWVDAREFERLVELGKLCRREVKHEEAISALQEADRLYAGDYLQDSPYQEWAVPERERLRQIEVEVLVHLGDLLAGREPDAAIDVFRRAVALDPYAELAYTGLIGLLAQTGRRTDALKQYQTLEEILRQDLRTAPSRETRALYRRILDRQA